MEYLNLKKNIGLLGVGNDGLRILSRIRKCIGKAGVLYRYITNHRQEKEGFLIKETQIKYIKGEIIKPFWVDYEDLNEEDINFFNSINILIMIGMETIDIKNSIRLIKEAKKFGILIVCIFEFPTVFERKNCYSSALKKIENLKELVNTSIVISRDDLSKRLSNDLAVKFFYNIDQVILNVVNQLVKVFLYNGVIKIRPLDVLRVFNQKNIMYFSLGKDTKVFNAVIKSFANPLVFNQTLKDCAYIIVHIQGGKYISLKEIKLIVEYMYYYINAKATLILGYTVIKNKLLNKVMITIFGAGKLKI